MPWATIRLKNKTMEMEHGYERGVRGEIKAIKKRITVLEDTERQKALDEVRAMRKEIRAARPQRRRKLRLPQKKALSSCFTPAHIGVLAAEDKELRKTNPTQKEPDMPYPAAQALQKVGGDLSGIVVIPEDQGEEFAASCRKLVKDLASIRRMIVATGSLGVRADEHRG